MPKVEKTHGNQVVIRGAGRFERGDRKDVSDEMAEYLTAARGDFAVVDEDGGVSEAEDDTDDESEAEAFDTNAWLGQDYTDREDRVRSGDVDDKLELIAESETSNTVLDAIGERRAELED